jgi:hypothetical protein
MLARIAFEDPQTIGNPREVDVAGYEEIYRNAFSRGPVSTATRDYSMVSAARGSSPVGRGWRRRARRPASRSARCRGTREDAQRAIAAANAAGATGRAAPRSSAPRRWSASRT